jgi:hypothetical protein
MLRFRHITVRSLFLCFVLSSSAFPLTQPAPAPGLNDLDAYSPTCCRRSKFPAWRWPW